MQLLVSVAIWMKSAHKTAVWTSVDLEDTFSIWVSELKVAEDTMELGFGSVIRIVRFRMMIVLLFVSLVCYAECGGGNSGINYGKYQSFSI